MELLNKIYLELIPEEEFSLDDFVKDVANKFSKGDYLLDGLFSKGESDGTFESMLWVGEIKMTKTHAFIDFTELESLRFKGIVQEDILLIKCWLAEQLIDGYSHNQVQSKFRSLINFLDETSNFSANFLEENKSNDMSFLNNPELEIKNSIINSIDAITSYIYYRENAGCRINPDTIGEYLTGLYTLQNNLNYDKLVRTLPSNANALAFGYYIDMFFNDKSIPQELKLYFMPVRIWWKISTVIPMRPSELCVSMERNCLQIDSNNFYLKINRVKRSVVKKKKRPALLPILKKIQISKEVYYMIDNYIKQTSSYGDTKTLFSWRALSAIRLSLNKYENKFVTLSPLCENNWKKKINHDYFTTLTLSTLLEHFYTKIIQGHYKDATITEQLRLHDTRHYAFTSLLIQGLSPVEIALIGGHADLKAQDSYQCNALYYVDNEVLNFVNQQKIGIKFSNRFLKDIVFQKSIICPTPMEKCQRTNEGIGYCTCNIQTDGLMCEDEEHCFKCSKWWCEPTEDSYNRLRKFIAENHIAPLEKKVETDVEFIKELIKQSSLIKLDDSLRADAEEERAFKTETMNLRRDVDTLIDLKKILLDLTRKSKIKSN